MQWDMVASALRNLDTQEERILPTTAKNASWMAEDPGTGLGDEDREEYYDLDSDDEPVFLSEVDAMDLREDECSMIFLALDKVRRKTWQENRHLKMAMKKDRQHFDKGGEALKHEVAKVRFGKRRRKIDDRSAEVGHKMRQLWPEGPLARRMPEPLSPTEPPQQRWQQQQAQQRVNVCVQLGGRPSSDGRARPWRVCSSTPRGLGRAAIDAGASSN